MELDGKIALVTGGAQGIGRCVVERLLERGVTVGVADVNAEALAALAAGHAGIEPLVCDLTDAAQVAETIGGFCQAQPRVDILVNNAGIIYNSPLVRLTPQGVLRHDVAAWDRTVATNLHSAFYVANEVAHRMATTRTRGVIVNVSSICAAGNAGQGAYSAAKAGVRALTVAWAKELGPFRIRVMAVAPGFTATPAMTASMDEEVVAQWKKQTPLKRFAQPEEVAETILHILRNDFLTGRVIELDGGLRM